MVFSWSLNVAGQGLLVPFKSVGITDVLVVLFLCR